MVVVIWNSFITARGRLCGKFSLLPVNKKKRKEGQGAAQENKFWLSFVGIFYTQKYLFEIHVGIFRPDNNVFTSKCMWKRTKSYMLNFFLGFSVLP